MSPTQRSLALLKKLGYLPAVTEKWNPHARIRQDLYGAIDLLGIKPGVILGVQATSISNIMARYKKAIALPGIKLWLQAGGGFEVWAFRKKKKTEEGDLWQVKRIIISLDDMLC